MREMWPRPRQRPFADRQDAGRKLVPALLSYKGQPAVVLAIPRGGVEVAYSLAQELALPLDVLVVRKVPVPWNPETGMGAVTAEGFVLLDEPLVRELRLSPEVVRRTVERVRREIERRRQLYRGNRPAPQLAERTVILVDDGLATGFTMLAAIRSTRRQNPSQVVAAVPVASASAATLIEREADELVSLVRSETPAFAVADFYRHWRDLTDEEVLALLHPEESAIGVKAAGEP